MSKKQPTIKNPFIIHGIYNNEKLKIRSSGKELRLPSEFEYIIFKTSNKYGNNEDGSHKDVSFTYYETDKACAISVAAPVDNFSKKLGIKICKGRIRKALENFDKIKIVNGVKMYKHKTIIKDGDEQLISFP